VLRKHARPTGEFAADSTLLVRFAFANFGKFRRALESNFAAIGNFMLRKNRRLRFVDAPTSPVRVHNSQFDLKGCNSRYPSQV